MYPYSRSQSSRALAPALAILLAAAAPAAVPTVDVTHHGPPTAQGVSETFLGSEGGRTSVYKPNAPIGQLSDGRPWMATGNLSGEWLGTRVMNQAGVSSPQVDMVRVRGRDVPFARIQHMQELFPGQKLAQGIDGLPKGAVLDLDAMRRMQAVDLLIGNTDRHGKNVWFHQDALTGRWKPIAFDHNLAMASTASTGNEFTAFQDPMTARSRTGVEVPHSQTRGILDRNSIYTGIMNDPRAAHGLLAEARHVQGSLSDQRIDQLVDSMPDEAIGPEDKEARRRELKQNLKRRRNHLVRTAEATLRNHPDYLRTEWRLAGLPENLRAHLPADLESRWRFVGAIRPDGRFDAGRLEAALATSGVPKKVRSQIRRQVRAQGGLPRRFWPRTSGDLAAIGDARKEATVRQMEKVKNPRVDFTGRNRYPTYDMLEVVATDKGTELRGVDGRTPPPDHTGVRKVAEKVKGEVQLKAGERIRITRKPTGLLQGIDVRVLDAGGHVTARSQYHTPLGKPVRTGRSLFKQQARASRKRRATPRSKVGSPFKIRFRPKIRLSGRK